MGCFDTVLIDCPHCNFRNEHQTKAGDCRLLDYKLDEAPLKLLAHLEDYNPFECEKCKKSFEVIVNVITQVRTRKVELDDETPK